MIRLRNKKKSLLPFASTAAITNSVTISNHRIVYKNCLKNSVIFLLMSDLPQSKYKGLAYPDRVKVPLK